MDRKAVSQTIAVFNQAGGVGKTTLTMNIGYHLAELNKKVLLLDLDPQASLTVFFGLKSKEISKTIYESLVKEIPLPVYANIHGMDLVPANINLSAAEKALSDAIMKELRLKNALFDLQNKYDFILIDCPPSLGFLSIMSLIAATHVLVPIQTQYKAIMGTQQLIDTIQRVRKYGNSQVKLAGVVPTMFDSRAKQEQESLKRIQKAFSQTTVWSPIARATDFVNASQAHVPFAHYAPKHPSVEILQTIAKDLVEAN
jgi:chromosome partitioning protein